MNELEIVRSELAFVSGVGENEKFEVIVVDILEPLLEVCAGFCVEGSHVLSKCKGLGYEQMVKFGGGIGLESRKMRIEIVEKRERFRGGGDPQFCVRGWLVGS